MKMMILAPRRPDMSHAQFRSYLTDVHGPLVRSVPEVAADFHSYVYNFPVQGQADPLLGHPLADLDVVTQGVFDSIEAQRANMRLPAYLERVRPDEGRFANEGRALMHYTSEHCVHEGPTSLHKVFWFRRRRQGLARDAFQRAWRDHYAPRMAELATTWGAATRFVLNETMPAKEHRHGDDPRYFDVIDELGLPPPGSAPRTGGAAWPASPSPAALANIRALEAEWLETGRTLALVTELVVSIPPGSDK